MRRLHGLDYAVWFRGHDHCVPGTTQWSAGAIYGRPAYALLSELKMADRLSRQKRSWLMSRGRGSNTLPERLVERFLRQHRIRFRRHARQLPGTPDIIVPERH